jgi:hypothetical protein
MPEPAAQALGRYDALVIVPAIKAVEILHGGIWAIVRCSLIFSP